MFYNKMFMGDVIRPTANVTKVKCSTYNMFFAVNTSKQELAPVTDWLSSRTLAALTVYDEN